MTFRRARAAHALAAAACVLTALAAAPACAEAADQQFKIFTTIVYPPGYAAQPGVTLTKSYTCQFGPMPTAIAFPLAKPLGAGTATTAAETWDVGHQNTMFVHVPYTPLANDPILMTDHWIYACRGSILANGKDVTLRDGQDVSANTFRFAANTGIGVRLTIDPAKLKPSSDQMLKIFTTIVWPTGFKPSPSVKFTKSYACDVGKSPSQISYPLTGKAGSATGTTPAETWDIGRQNTMFLHVPYSLPNGEQIQPTDAYAYACRGTILANGQDVTLRDGQDVSANTMAFLTAKGVGVRLTVDASKLAQIAHP